jgi:hypothetical protein
LAESEEFGRGEGGKFGVGAGEFTAFSGAELEIESCEYDDGVLEEAEPGVLQLQAATFAGGKAEGPFVDGLGEQPCGFRPKPCGEYSKAGCGGDGWGISHGELRGNLKAVTQFGEQSGCRGEACV